MERKSGKEPNKQQTEQERKKQTNKQTINQIRKKTRLINIR
jgi:hypothetical protein